MVADCWPSFHRKGMLASGLAGTLQHSASCLKALSQQTCDKRHQGFTQENRGIKSFKIQFYSELIGEAQPAREIFLHFSVENDPPGLEFASKRLRALGSKFWDVAPNCSHTINWVILPSHFLFWIIILHVAISGHFWCFPCLAIRHVGMTVFRPGFSANWRSVLDFCGFNLAEWWPPSTRRQSRADFSAEWATRCAFDGHVMAIFGTVLWEYHKTGASEKKSCFNMFQSDFGFWIEGTYPAARLTVWRSYPHQQLFTNKWDTVFVLILVTQHSNEQPSAFEPFPYFGSYCTSPCLIACVAWLCFDIEVGSPGLLLPGPWSGQCPLWWAAWKWFGHDGGIGDIMKPMLVGGFQQD